MNKYEVEIGVVSLELWKILPIAPVYWKRFKSAHDSTITVELGSRIIQINDKAIKLQILDAVWIFHLIDSEISIQIFAWFKGKIQAANSIIK